MMKRRRFPHVALAGAVALVTAASLALGCHGTAAPAKAEKPPAASPWTKLAAMDHRRPVPLLPMMALHQKHEMAGHLAAIQGILAGLAAHDFAAVARSAKAIGTSPAMTMTCNRMGAGAPGFTEAGLAFHRDADAIVAAAKKHDEKAILAATAKTLTACTGCHATYRQDVVDPKTWSAKTGMTPPSMGAKP